MTITRDQARQAVLEQLKRIAPEMADADLPSDADLREELDLDSMDMLTLMTRLHEAVGVDIPEKDYPKLTTIDGCVDYLTAD